MQGQDRLIQCGMKLLIAQRRIAQLAVRLVQQALKKVIETLVDLCGEQRRAADPLELLVKCSTS